ncbi:MAG TPA: response regulator transcription factor [Polyangiaceae bacterium]|nr:response regulator transcription factor [Polyangiaceae bacterium]
MTRTGSGGSLQVPGAPYIRNLPNLLRIAVIAEDSLVQNALVSLLGAEPDFRVVGQAGTPDDTLGGLAGADVLLWDVGTRAASARDPSLFARTATLALVRDEEAALDWLRAGALGVLLRSPEGERLVAALRAVATGLGVFDPTLVRSLLSTRAAARDTLQLTPREAEVLSLMAEGLSNKLIADRLKISDHTAKFHVNAILNKLDAETRTEAVVSAARRGLLML